MASRRVRDLDLLMENDMRGRNMTRLSVATVVAMAGASFGLASVSYAQSAQPGGNNQAAEPVRLNALYNGLSTEFLVDRADAPSSPAKRVWGTSGIEESGYALHNRVVVKSDNLKLVQALASRDGLSARSPRLNMSQDVPGWVIVEVDTVREAVNIANALRASGQFGSVSVEADQPRIPHELPTDPLVANQWHLENTINIGDINASAIYDLGYTGAGITVGILEFNDDNFKVDHEDLAANWAQSLSMDTTPFSNIDSQTHAVSVAGLIAGVANNGIGIAGVAYDSKLARLRNGTMLVLGSAMQWRFNQIQIHNNSWGPANPPFLFPAHTEDDYVMDAYERGIRFGRSGAGRIYLFSAGNDGPVDRVDYQPLASSRWSMAIGAVDENNDIASYSQPGTSLFATTYSGPGGPSPFRQIQTTGIDLPEPPGPFGVDETYIPDINGRGLGFNGTSASCPIAAGIVALMLDANPNLTYRDVQHIIADTAIPSNFVNQSLYFYVGGGSLVGETWWQVNGAFTRHSDEYGFGVIDALAAVTAAESWTGVREQRVLDTFLIPVAATIPPAQFVEFPPDSGEFVIDTAAFGINWSTTFCVKPDIALEAVELEITATGGWAGDLEILLISPWGTVSPLAVPRPDPGNYTNYVFTTLKHWDERSAGEWTLQITDFIPDGPFDVDMATVDLAPYQIDGIPGAAGKSVPSIQVRMYGTDVPDPDPFLCDPNNQNCPGDLNGDGIVSPADLMIFLELYNIGDPFADINGDGVVNYNDLLQFFGSFIPGFCPSPDNDGPGGRPIPGGSGSSTPIGPGA